MMWCRTLCLCVVSWLSFGLILVGVSLVFVNVLSMKFVSCGEKIVLFLVICCIVFVSLVFEIVLVM